MKTLRACLIIVLPALAVSCSDVNGPSDWYDQNASAAVTLERIEKRSIEGITTQDRFSATFYHPDSSGGIIAGDVVVSGISSTQPVPLLPEKSRNEGVHYEGTADNPITSPLRFNRVPVQLDIAGNAAFPAFKLSLKAPFSALDVLYPAPDDKVSKSEDLTVRWSTLDPAGEQVSVSIISADGSGQIYSRVGPDNGQHTIKAADLATIGPNTALLIVERFHPEYLNAPGRRRIHTNIKSQTTIAVTLVP